MSYSLIPFSSVLASSTRGGDFNTVKDIDFFNDVELEVEAVDNMYHPATEWEQEMFSEAIIYAKHAVLN